MELLTVRDPRLQQRFANPQYHVLSLLLKSMGTGHKASTTRNINRTHTHTHIHTHNNRKKAKTNVHDKVRKQVPQRECSDTRETYRGLCSWRRIMAHRALWEPAPQFAPWPWACSLHLLGAPLQAPLNVKGSEKAKIKPTNHQLITT